MGHCAMVKIVVWGWSSQLQEALQPCLFFSDSRGGTTATAGTGKSLRTGSEVSATSEHLPLLVESPAAKTAGVCRVRRGVVGGLK